MLPAGYLHLSHSTEMKCKTVRHLFYLDCCRVLKTVCLGFGQALWTLALTIRTELARLIGYNPPVHRAVITTTHVKSPVSTSLGVYYPITLFLVRSFHLSHEWLSKSVPASHNRIFRRTLTYKSNPTSPHCRLFPSHLWHTHLHPETSFIFSGRLPHQPFLPSSVPHLVFLSLTWSLKWTPSLALRHHVPYIFS